MPYHEDDDPMDDFNIELADAEEANENMNPNCAGCNPDGPGSELCVDCERDWIKDNPREKGDDDGVEYGHPDDERDERLHDGFND